ncbi:MFS transporter [Actinospica sp.]|uniref:MFS transporter n=1 Tax=Actinospica sp. TaxID=1872142 RepID=UPI002B7EE650|nr:MFS transporter [Actinospica sp.]HWG26852.1 MFS transporter [Actinospica sp.]
MTTTTSNRKWLGLSAILAATLMDLLDSTVLNIAGPAIHRSLGGSTAALQWFSAAYTLALAAGLLVGGRLGDMYGRRRMLLGSAVGFTAASVACAFAWSPTSLIAARAVQGLIAAMMVPQSFGLLRDLFPGKEMSKAFALFGPAIGLSTILGPVVAGALVNANILGTGWRSVFLINLLLGGYTIVLGRRTLPNSAPTARGSRLDLVGALLGGAGMTMLIYPLIEGRESGWPAWCFALMVGSVPVFALFVLRQRLLGRRGGASSPLIDLGVFRNRSYTSGLVFILSFFGVVVGFSLAFGLFLQLGLGYSAMHASLTSTSLAAGAFVGSALSGTLGPKLGRRIIHLGLAVMGVGTIGLLLVLDHAGAGVSGWDMSAPLAVYGLGMGAIFVPLFGLVIGDVPTHQIGSASGVLECVQQFGAALGVAVLGTVFFNAFGAHAYAAPASAVHAAKLIGEIALGLTAISFLLVFLLPRHGQPEHGAAEQRPQDVESTDDVQQPELAGV